MSLSAISSPSSVTYSPQRHYQYAPQTPSPLSTSRNANLMPPPTPASTLKATPGSKSQPFSFTTPKTAISSSPTSDVGRTTGSSSTSVSSLPFQLQNRSRSQSPQASLTKYNAAAKTRRLGLFLDKVRQKREDSRFETRGEQALRMDFVRERREWEERLKRRAPSFDIEADSSLVDDIHHDMEDRDQAIHSEDVMPSPTEDREIEELLSYLEADEARATGGRQSDRSVTDSAYCDSALSDDEDYDQLFMEVMADDSGTLQAGMLEGRVWREADQTQESCMDLS